MLLILVVFTEIQTYVEVIPVSIVRNVMAISVFGTAARSVSTHPHTSLFDSEQILPFLELHIAFDIFLGLVVLVVVIKQSIPLVERNCKSDLRNGRHIPHISRILIGRRS